MSHPHRAFLTLLFLTLVNLGIQTAHAQTENTTAETQTPKATKFDEFGDINESYLKARLDNFAVMLQSDPVSRGFIIIYRTPRDIAGLNHRLAMRIKDYLVDSRGIDRERLVSVDGGVTENLTQELWIVAPGGAPVPRSDARVGYTILPDSAWKFDEYGYLPLSQYRKFGFKRNREAEAEHLEAYANEVKKKPNQLACIIAYAQYNRNPPLVDWAGDYEPRRETRLDAPATARRRLGMDKENLMVHGLPASRIKLIDGGYRKRRSLEFWIVPPGEPLPIPTPNAFPPKRKRRK